MPTSPCDSFVCKTLLWEVSQWSRNTGTWYPTGLRKPTRTVSQTCLYGHSPNQSLVAHAGSATVSSNVNDHVGQIKRPEFEQDCLGMGQVHSRCHLECVATLFETNTAVQSVAVLQPPMLPGRWTVNGQKVCILSVVA
eukprot:6197862-Pleurochrysis_carterae.AAC.1